MQRFPETINAMLVRILLLLIYHAALSRNHQCYVLTKTHVRCLQVVMRECNGHIVEYIFLILFSHLNISVNIHVMFSLICSSLQLYLLSLSMSL